MCITPGMKMFIAQVMLLETFGILPLGQGKLLGRSRKWRFCSTVHTMIGISYLIGTLYSSAINGAHFLYGFFRTSSETNSNSVCATISLSQFFRPINLIKHIYT